MKQQIQQIEDPLEYFIPESFGFKFVYTEAQNPDYDFAEQLINEIKEKK